MIRTIFATVVNRFAVMAFAMATVLLNTHCLGDVGQGEVALINFAILIMLSIAHYAGGGALVYLAPRLQAANLWRPAYLWSLLVGLGGFGLMSFFEAVPSGAAWAVALLALMQSLYSYHMHILLGAERIRAYNTLQLVHAGGLALMLALFYLVFHLSEVTYYLWGAGVAIGLTYVVSLILCGGHLFQKADRSSGDIIREIWRYGKWSQSGNVFQTIAYRAPYSLIQFFFQGATGLVGVFSINTYVSEAIWNVSKSLALVQYSRLSNVFEAENRLALSLVFLRISVLVTLPPVLVVLLIPANTWVWILGEGFGPVVTLMPWAAAGIVANSASMIISHHFSGSGKHRFNALTSLGACVGVLTAGWLLIPDAPLIGAAQAFSAGMLLQLFLSLVLFIRDEKLTFWQLVVPKGDLALLRRSGAKKG